MCFFDYKLFLLIEPLICQAFHYTLVALNWKNAYLDSLNGSIKLHYRPTLCSITAMQYHQYNTTQHNTTHLSCTTVKVENEEKKNRQQNFCAFMDPIFISYTTNKWRLATWRCSVSSIRNFWSVRVFDFTNQHKLCRYFIYLRGF